MKKKKIFFYQIHVKVWSNKYDSESYKCLVIQISMICHLMKAYELKSKLAEQWFNLKLIV